MRGSLKLFTWFGIPVHLHWSFGLILIYAFYLGYSEGAGMMSALLTMGIFIALFGCVLLHEFGHSLTAQRYGVKTQDIILTPIGGIARLERMPEKPMQEFLVAIAGPMVNVVIAVILFFVGKMMYSGVYWDIFKASISDQFEGILHFFSTVWQFISGKLSLESLPEAIRQRNEYSEVDIIKQEANIQPGVVLEVMPLLLGVNIWLVLFNLLPAFPMDGGRVFRALMAMRIGRVRATKIASVVGQAIAVIFIFTGIFSGPITMALIGFFVFNTARTENMMVQTDSLLQRFKAKDMMRTTFTHLNLNDWMQTATDLLQQGGEQNFLVFDFQDNLVGVLDENAVISALKKRDLSASVSSYYSPTWEAVHPDESLQYVYYQLKHKGMSIVPVVGEDRILGVIDEAGLAYFMRLQGDIEA